MVEGSNIDGSRTDKKEVIAAVLQELNHPSADQLLMVGDRKYDVIGAREIGFDCVGVNYGFADPGELEASHPRYIAQSVEDLTQYLLSV